MAEIQLELDYLDSLGLDKIDFYKSFGKQYGLHLHFPLVSKLSANFMIFSLFLRISEICCLLMPYSAHKLVPFSLFSNCKIIDRLSFIERRDPLHFKDTMIMNKHS